MVIPFLGTIIYLIVRPPEYLDEARERELELLALEQRLGELGDAEGKEIVGRMLAREGFPADPERPACSAACARPAWRRARTCATWISGSRSWSSASGWPTAARSPATPATLRRAPERARP